MEFPKHFIWGAASSSYQTEGAWDGKNRGESIWDAFCQIPGAVKNGESGDAACDGYHLYAEDVKLLRQMGLSAYRFSISWPRIFPTGSGEVNPEGFVYYDRLVDLLLEQGITPYITLYHWDLPTELQKNGGWQNRETAYAFAEYAKAVAEHFSGRVRHYITLNEPQCFIGLGYGIGEHAPGLQLQEAELLECGHNALLAHGLAVRAMREIGGNSIEIGFASTGQLCYPAQPTLENQEAAYRASFAVETDRWWFSHAWFLDAAVLGHYPADAPSSLQHFAESVPKTDWDIICQPLDFLGLNVYNGHQVDQRGKYMEREPGFPRTSLKWPVTPQVIRYGCRWLHRRYGLPLFITENGQACNDRIFLDGKVHDPDRIDFLHRYLRELRQACEEGIPVRGYFHWSLTDNFEWHNGYDDRMGLIFIHYPTQRRIKKDSAYWYEKVVKSNGRTL